MLMISLPSLRNTVSLPNLYEWLKQKYYSFNKSIKISDSFSSVLGTICVFIIGTAMLFYAFGIHMPFSSKIPNTKTPLLSDANGSSQPNVINAPPKNSKNCKGYQADIKLFAACPSFYVDYSARKKGILDTRLFNAYVGAPVANNEVQYYSNNPANVRIENGSLVLEARNDLQQGYRYTSARIDTKGKEDFLYGRIVVRATLPSSIGTWPAIWLLPSEPKYAKLSPASDTTSYLNDGEVDIAESIGTEPNVVYGVAHSLAYTNDGVDRTYFNTVTVPNNNNDFHDYSLDWTPDKLTLKIDGKEYFSIDKKSGADYHSWPYDQPFYLTMNLALGGNWAGKDLADFPIDGVDSTKLPASLKVQSLMYYSYTGAL